MVRGKIVQCIDWFATWPRRWAFIAIVIGSIVSSVLAVYFTLVWFSPSESQRVWRISLISATIISAVVSSFVAYCLLTMTDALKLANDKAELLANTDSLTGVLNRRRFSELAREALSADYAAGEPTSLVLIDVDNFKGINDRFGHAAGDTALQILVSSCQRNLREEDEIARWGGEEFVILFPRTTSEDGFGIADRIRQSVADELIEFDGTRVSLTISTGLVTRQPPLPPSLDLLVTKADLAMYTAKTTGKNKVVASPTDEEAA